MIISNLNTNFIVKNICDGAGCFKEATQTVIEIVGTMGSITLQLCDDCTDNFCGIRTRNSTKTKKEEFEQQVEGPTCSNISNQNQSIQQHGVLLDD
jgi:hypothetical protein